MNEKCIIKWYLDNPKAKIPTKSNDAAGFDIYTIEDFVIIPAHCQHLFSTGLKYTIEGPYWLMGCDRGSTGSKGLHIHCGVCDRDYRGEVFVCIKNDNDYPAIFTAAVDRVFIDDGYLENYHGPILYYPVMKAIAQLVPVYQPETESIECSAEDWVEACAKSARGEGKLGSSGK